MSVNDNIARKLSDRVRILSTKSLDMALAASIRDVADEIEELEEQLRSITNEVMDLRVDHAISMWPDGGH
jgi:hypothetical protein